jgi:phage portal protein BeeE
MTGIELKYVTMAHLELTGNASWLLDGVSDDRTPPKAIYPLDPGRVRVHLQKDVFPYKLDHYTFTVDNKVFTFQPHQILHIKYPDPSDPFVGIGIPQTLPSWIDSDNYAMEYNRKFFINGAPVGNGDSAFHSYLLMRNNDDMSAVSLDCTPSVRHAISVTKRRVRVCVQTQ